jgi:hypothetical protein
MDHIDAKVNSMRVLPMSSLSKRLIGIVVFRNLQWVSISFSHSIVYSIEVRMMSEPHKHHDHNVVAQYGNNHLHYSL